MSDDEYHDAKSKVSESVLDDLINQHNSIKLDDEHEGDDCEKLKNQPLGEEYEDAELVDEEALKEMEKDMTEEDKLLNKEKAKLLKDEANELFKSGEFEKCVELYTNALKIAPTSYPNERSILYANRAAAKIKLNSINPAIEDCTQAIKLNPNYPKPYHRRAKLFEENNNLDESLADYKKLLELDPRCQEALCAITRLPPLIEERNEKLKSEVLGKLKDLGNMILKPFGLSTNNFQMQQDPNTGGYSVNFNQNSQ